MTYFAYIDESGQFKPRGKNKNLVGGFITTQSHDALRQKLLDVVNDANQGHEMKFQLSDCHIAPLLHCDDATFKALNTRDGQYKYSRLQQFPSHRRKALADAFYKELIGIAEHFFCCCDDRIEFVDVAPQERYGRSLELAIRQARVYMERIGVDPKEVCFVLAPRSAICIPQINHPSRAEEFKKLSAYHAQIANLLQTQLGVKVSYSTKEWRSHGLAWADVACYYLRQYINGNKDLLGGNVAVDSVKNATVGRFYESSYSELLSRGALAEAIRWARDKTAWERLCKSIATVDAAELRREIAQLISAIEERISARAKRPGILEETLELLVVLEKRIAEERVQGAEGGEGWTESYLAILELSLACDNHLGGTEGQSRLREMHRIIMKEEGDALPSVWERRDRALAMANRAWNQQFNNFDFDAVIAGSEATLSERQAQIGTECDELTGKMCGTLGQAYAFKARLEPECVIRATEYFEASLRYLNAPGTTRKSGSYRDMSTNYLTTLQWQSKNLPAALEAFGRHDFANTATPTSPLDALRLLRQAPGRDFRAFDLLTVLRLFENESDDGLRAALPDLQTLWRPDFGQGHPHQLIAKWMGWIHLRLADFTAARTCFDMASEIAATNNFAVCATVVPVYGLALVDALNRDTGIASQWESRLWETVDELEAQSEPFSSYLEQSGGRETWQVHLDRGDLQAILRWMPFAYA